MPDLFRFVVAQAPVYENVVAELTRGRKATHWMWFVFPQLRGLGQSDMARRYALEDLNEARAYLHHEILAARLLTCTDLVNRQERRSAYDIFGSPDDLKFRSCMTLFAQVAEPGSVFEVALRRYFNDEPDKKTLALLASSGQSRDR